MNFFYYLALMRPANIITAIADILAGVAIAGLTLSQISENSITDVLMLVLATIGLYGGGVVFNDFFDYEIDKEERPERPIPSGKVSKKQAAVLGGALLLTGVISASIVGSLSGCIALSICALVLLYDKFAKHYLIFGPLVMGLCRACNLLLGISITPLFVDDLWPICIVPVLFIAAITLISRGEVIGNNRLSVGLAMFLDASVVGAIYILSTRYDIQLLALIPFLTVWIFLNFEAKIRAIIKNNPSNIMRAVKMGVISLIPLNASLSAGFGGWAFGLVVLALLPLSMFLAARFAVT